MSRPNAYVREIKSLNAEIKRLNTRLRKLRAQRKEKQTLLHGYMEKNNLQKYEGITIKSIRPRSSIPRKPEIAKKNDAIDLFREVGIPNPEAFYAEFKTTQKYVSGEEPPPSEPKRKTKKKNGYDPFLGF